jgi:hypothetical protein
MRTTTVDFTDLNRNPKAASDATTSAKTGEAVKINVTGTAQDPKTISAQSLSSFGGPTPFLITNWRSLLAWEPQFGGHLETQNLLFRKGGAFKAPMTFIQL